MSRIVAGTSGLPDSVDVLVVGLGVTGAGVALDAASRGLSVAAVDAFDLAWGTSRWSSKLVHGGLRYLAAGKIGIAHESAVERGILMEHTAPHLVHALPLLIPLTGSVSPADEVVNRVGLFTADVLRRTARTRRATLPRPRRLGVTETLAMAPAIRRRGLRGALLTWDGQLEDDARLVVTLARTAATHGAHVHTRSRVLEATGTRAVLRDERTGETREIGARAVVSATGVWAAGLDPGIRLRPSLGTHLVVDGATLPRLQCAIATPVPGTAHEYVSLVPQPNGRIHVGLTDEEVPGPLPDVPEVPEHDIDFLLDMAVRALEHPLTRSDVVGAYAGLRPLLEAGGSTADLSRRHAVLTSTTGVVTIVGGKLTTYRRMAQDTVDHLVRTGSVSAGRCRTRRLPLLGAAGGKQPDMPDVPTRLVRRFGAEARAVLDDAVAVTGLPARELAREQDRVTLAELVFGVTHEGATTVEDLLDRRTRVGLVPAERAAALPLAERALDLAASADERGERFR
ncbi:MAG: glycerol-3-phosphate dehydrogenase/oxidase [Marmoricola sp.]